MAKSKIRTIGPELEREIRWAIDQTRRLVRGDLQAEPPPPPKAPDDYVVLTPPAGIPRRRKRRIFSAWCNVYKEVETAPATRGAAKRLEPIRDGNGANFQLPVYNIYCEDVPGSLLVPTALLKSGTRYVLDWIECSSSRSKSSSRGSSSKSSSRPSSSEASSHPSSSKSSSRPSSGGSSSQPPSSQPSSSEESSSEPSASDSGPSEGSEPPPSENSGASGSEVSGASEASVQSEASEASEASDESGASGASETSDSEPSSESWSGSTMSGSGGSGSGGSASSVAESSGSPPPPFDCEDDRGHCLYYANSSLEWYLFMNGCFVCGCNYATGGDPTCPPPQFESDYCVGPCRPAGFW